MALRIFNTMARTKEELTPLVPGEVRIYSCGVTPYDQSHIGHARMLLIFDTVVRYLRFKGFKVRFVRNFTDVDDKIIRRAQREGVPAAEVSERYIAAFHEDMAALGVAPADVEPKATEHVPQMIALIERLLARGVAYVVDGDVYFEVRRFPPYGRLSRKNLDDLVAGARVEVDERKRDPRDFALWKSTKPGEPAWESPWGPGRPGWHIECSAMSTLYLGETFDIHGGGDDLVFPHHECEIAQSEAVTDRPLARVWMHNGMVNLGAEKMSKSLGNTLTIKSLLERHHPDAVRRYLLATHYRNPLEFWEARIHESRLAIGKLRNLVIDGSRRADRLEKRVRLPAESDISEASVRARAEGIADVVLRDQVGHSLAVLVAGMDDDFNTPQALAALADLGGHLSRYRDVVDARQGSAVDFITGIEVLWRLGCAMGFFYKQIDIFEPTIIENAQVDALLAEREDARKRKDWKRADEIRDQIHAMGRNWRIEDTPHGPRVVQEH